MVVESFNWQSICKCCAMDEFHRYPLFLWFLRTAHFLKMQNASGMKFLLQTAIFPRDSIPFKKERRCYLNVFHKIFERGVGLC
jgi:hypothetical protein